MGCWQVRLLLATLVLLVALAAPASAQQVVNDPEIDAFVAVAQQQLGPVTHCPTGVRIVAGDFLANAGVWASVKQTTIDGATVAECEIRLESDHYPRPPTAGYGVWDEIMCKIIVHEWGHVLGKTHVEDPTDLMYPLPPLSAAPGCVKVQPTVYPAKEIASTTAFVPSRPRPRKRCHSWRTKRHRIKSCRRGTARWKVITPRKRSAGKRLAYIRRVV